MANGKIFSENDIKILKDNCDKLSIQEVATLLNRSYNSTYDKIRKLGLNYNMIDKRYWTEEEINYLKDSINKIPIKRIAKKLNRTIGSIHGKMVSEKIELDWSHTTWSDSEDKILFDNRFILTLPKVSLLLNKPLYSVYNRLKEKGISYSKTKRPTKVCTQCKNEFPNTDDFFSIQNYKIKLKSGEIKRLTRKNSSCKECLSEYGKTWRTKHPIYKEELKNRKK